ncbi:MAG: apolipoprotein N-acyltransferase, partial [[Mycobacterium] stephanolepidis]
MADETVDESVAEIVDEDVTDLTDLAEAADVPVDEESEATGETGPARGAAFVAAVRARGIAFGRAWLRAADRQGAAVIGGLMLCASFPPWGFWWAAFPALSILGLVLWSSRTGLRGGLGYGLLFGLAFYVPLLPWTGQLVGAVPWLALSLLCATWVALFGVLAVAVRRLPGWPLWFAAAWSATEWGKASVPFGGFPWGRVAFGQGDGPMLSLARYGGAPLVSFTVALGAFAV